MVGESSSNYEQPLKQLANFIQQTDGSIRLLWIFFGARPTVSERDLSDFQTCVEQTHSQSENAQGQHLRDMIGEMSHEAFDNPNSLLLCNHYVGGSDDGVCVIVVIMSVPVWEEGWYHHFEDIRIDRFHDHPGPEFIYNQPIWLSSRISVQIEKEIFPYPIYGPPDDIFEW